MSSRQIENMVRYHYVSGGWAHSRAHDEENAHLIVTQIRLDDATVLQEELNLLAAIFLTNKQLPEHQQDDHEDLLILQARTQSVLNRRLAE